MLKQAGCPVAGLVALAMVLFSSPAWGEPVDVGPLLEKLRAVGPKGQGHREAQRAWQKLAEAEAEQIPEILAGMHEAGPLASNWIRAAVDAIAQRRVHQGGQLPLVELERLLSDRRHAPRARRVAYELIQDVDPPAAERLIPGMLNDPSLELRRDAVAHALQEAEKLVQADDQPAAVAAYRETLSAARDVDQIQQASEKLRQLGQTVDLPSHFGFVMRWKLIGPFDNTDKQGFDVDYPPEQQIDLEASYDGKGGQVQWIDHTTEDQYGMVDLNKALGKHMGAAGYAYAEFLADQPRDVELRLGCINANKVWLNGQLLSANEVYHAGTRIDQYVGQGRLKQGRNTILVKVCQNEQEDAWAQNWRFQLRVCDQYGTAVLSQDRPVSQTASRPATGRGR